VNIVPMLLLSGMDWERERPHKEDTRNYSFEDVNCPTYPMYSCNRAEYLTTDRQWD